MQEVRSSEARIEALRLYARNLDEAPAPAKTGGGTPRGRQVHSPARSGSRRGTTPPKSVGTPPVGVTSIDKPTDQEGGVTSAVDLSLREDTVTAQSGVEPAARPEPEPELSTPQPKRPRARPKRRARGAPMYSDNPRFSDSAATSSASGQSESQSPSPSMCVVCCACPAGLGEVAQHFVVDCRRSSQLCVAPCT